MKLSTIKKIENKFRIKKWPRWLFNLIHPYRAPRYCLYPVDGLDYCWGFAEMVNTIGRKKALKLISCRECEFRREEA